MATAAYGSGGAKSTFPSATYAVRFHALTVPLIGDGFGVRRGGSGAAADRYQLPWMQPYGGVAGGDDGGDSVFAGHQAGVRSQAAAVGDDGSCSSEQRRPCRSGSFRDKHIAVAEPAEVLRAVHDAYRSGSASRRCGMPDDDVLADFSLTTGFLRDAADHIPDQPSRLPEGQRCGEVALPLPQVAALPHEVTNRLTPGSPKGGGDFVAGAEEHIIGLFDRTGRDHVFAEPADAGRQAGHPRLKSRACSSRMTV